ncbi:MAG TPA: 3'(2'),5'-bisphosphate nucleotidase CysQ [Acidimicrobiales bacterium]|jgi:3'(2'), 5'-bisphosphate nucleotidase|nr:3'(2'),5'-bisphosphate nucleotidase CysQ [Acidimicrobiales bacterium]HJM28550.1 3'(2'),5'-bisphosphate nucleotidase CysQ [Acidimicrobiales bacterium]HJM97468.1 3'(2'),5'-bisphosphate nucleotidase CysQ [Acidimicrobiales bacterium]
MDDNELAGYLAELAGVALLDLRDKGIQSGLNSWLLRDEGDLISHNLLLQELNDHRPNDAVLSEEGTDDQARLDADRVWIIDPLDGSQDYPYNGSEEWAVHIALVENGELKAGAVSCPALNIHYSTAMNYPKDRQLRDQRLIVSNRWNSYQAAFVAESLDARLVSCGSAGVKASLVVGGDADIYIHGSGLYEWDVCAPVAVARAAGLSACQLDGSDFEFNKKSPIAKGLVICHSEFMDEVLQVLNGNGQ